MCKKIKRDTMSENENFIDSTKRAEFLQRKQIPQRGDRIIELR